MGFLEVLTGRRKLAKPAPDRLFAMSTAYVTFETSLGLESRGAAAIVFQPLATADFDSIVRDMEEVVRGTAGELACRAPGLMLGYHGQAAAGDVLDDQGWYYTGDLAVLDADGCVRIVGRKRDVMIRGGQNVVPAELERVLLDHPAQVGSDGDPDAGESGRRAGIGGVLGWTARISW